MVPRFQVLIWDPYHRDKNTGTQVAWFTGDDDNFGLALYLYKHTSDHDRSISQGKSQGQKGVISTKWNQSYLFAKETDTSSPESKQVWACGLTCSGSSWNISTAPLLLQMDSHHHIHQSYKKIKWRMRPQTPQERIRQSPTKRHPIHFSISRFLSSLHPDVWIQDIIVKGLTLDDKMVTILDVSYTGFGNT